jgi:hypothetical protein
MVDRATRWKFAWQQSPLAACPQEVKDGVEDGTKVGGARSPARTSRRQNRGNQGPCRVGQVGIVEWSAHRNGPFGPDQRSFKSDVNFSNTLLDPRFDVLVHAKEVLRVVLLLNGHKPLVVGTVGSFDRVFSLLT